MAYQKIFDISRWPDRVVGFSSRDPGEDIRHPLGDRRGDVYLYAEDLELAINVALVTNRPLLVTGRPGTGKSSLARNIARVLNWRYLETTITSQTQARDLLYELDLVRRLADAQAGRLKKGWRSYVKPGVLWWAFAPDSAGTRGSGKAQAKHLPDPARRPEEGRLSARREATAAHAVEERAAKARTAEVHAVAAPLAEEKPLETAEAPGSPHPSPTTGAATRPVPAVVLLDEIDKADPDVPNNLLHPLGALRFAVDVLDGLEVSADYITAPLVIITTNGERALPDAFLRRCVQVELTRPEPERLVLLACRWFGDEHRELFKRIAGDEAFEPEPKGPETGRAQGWKASIAEYLDAVQVARFWSFTAQSPEIEQVLKVTVGKKAV